MYVIRHDAKGQNGRSFFVQSFDFFTNDRRQLAAFEQTGAICCAHCQGDEVGTVPEDIVWQMVRTAKHCLHIVTERGLKPAPTEQGAAHLGRRGLQPPQTFSAIIIGMRFTSLFLAGSRC